MKKGMKGFLNDRKGLSEVVTALIMVLLVIVALMIVWGVVSNLLNNNKKNADTGRLTVDVKAESVMLSSPTEITVKIKRNAGEGDLKKLKIILSDGTNSQSFEKEVSDLGEFGEKTFTFIDGTDITSPLYASLVKTVTIVPLIGENLNAGVESNKDLPAISYEAYVAGLAPTAWWRFDNNDFVSTSVNAHTASSSVGTAFQLGKIGNGVYLLGLNGVIVIPAHSDFDFGSNDFTLNMWINPTTMSGDKFLFTNYNTNPYWLFGSSATCPGPGGLELSSQTASSPCVRIPYVAEGGSSSWSGQLNQWHMITFVRSGNSFMIIRDGSEVLKSNTLGSSPTIGNSVNPIRIGMQAAATIDEVTIFKGKALTPTQIQAIYDKSK